MRLFRPGFLAGCLYPEAIFRIKTAERKVYLTFDDGPDPESTPRVLDILKKYGVSAIFFCNGYAAEKYPGLMHMIRQDGHIIGNHGYNHLNGWRNGSMKYLNDVTRASKLTSDKIFRPPFGRLTFRQARLLRSYKLFFWDIMAYDFDGTFGSEKSLSILKRKIRPGSIIVLHDTTSSCAIEILDEFLVFAHGKGYRFDIF